MPPNDPDRTPKILVLMAAHNGSAWISEQIHTILAQENVLIDLVISDDHSMDDTRDKIHSFDGDARIRTLSPPKATGSAAQNFFWLIRHAPLTDQDFVALADQDDLWSSQKMKRGARLLLDSGASAYSCAVDAIWMDGRRRVLSQVRNTTRSDFLFEGAGQGCTFMLTAGFFREARLFFDAEHDSVARLHFHDWTLYALARSWNRAWYFDDRPMMQYRQHRANDTGARSSLAGMKRRLMLIRGGWYREQLTQIARVAARAAPTDTLIAHWNGLLAERRGFRHRLRVSLFCVRGGRRRIVDRLILILSAVIGWI